MQIIDKQNYNFRIYDSEREMYLKRICLDFNYTKKFYYLKSDLHMLTLDFCMLLPDYYRVEQSLGIDDKNNKTIYQGDILKTKDGRLGFIDWNDFGFSFCIGLGLNGDRKYEQINKEESYYEIIGNINEQWNLVANMK